MNKISIVFLDIDGVLKLNTYIIKLFLEWEQNGGELKQRDEFGEVFCPETVSNLEFLCKETNAKIVIISDWRSVGLEIMQECFKKRNIDVEVYDITPDLSYLEDETNFFNVPRGKEIEDWLSKHNEVEKYVIIDDTLDFLDYQMPLLIQTKDKTGLTKELTEKAIKLLND